VTAAFEAGQQPADVHVAVGVEDAVADVDHDGLSLPVFIANADTDNSFGEQTISEKPVPRGWMIEVAEVRDGHLSLDAGVFLKPVGVFAVSLMTLWQRI